MRATTLVFMFFFVVSAAVPARAAAVPISRVSVITDVIFDPDNEIPEIISALVQDDESSYLATPGGLYRLPRELVAGAPAELIAFEGRRVTGLYLHDGSLYVLKQGEEVQGTAATDHTFLRSDDGGETFVPMDAGLEACYGGYCGFMNSSQAAFEGERIYLNAGGNFIVSPDAGESWTALVGEMTPAACYDPSFELIGNRVLLGGECPLDQAWIRAGELEDGALRWTSEPESVITPDLENRNIQFLRHVKNTSIVYAGIEGALLRSVDLGASFDFVLHYVDPETEKYPYIGHMLISSANPDHIIIGGFDKRQVLAWVAYSTDGGATWIDRSDLLQFPGFTFRELVFLHEDAAGRIFAGLQDFDSRVIRIVELHDGGLRRRPARPRLD
ncbi:MAG TPA: hypothetical protein VMS12_07630 [Thermoanaerobaculia bacterium]|nr:hypothetical protein [Thermoanaerobaculia bacterium]